MLKKTVKIFRWLEKEARDERKCPVDEGLKEMPSIAKGYNALYEIAKNKS